MSSQNSRFYSAPYPALPPAPASALAPAPVIPNYGYYPAQSNTGVYPPQQATAFYPAQQTPAPYGAQQAGALYPAQQTIGYPSPQNAGLSSSQQDAGASNAPLQGLSAPQVAQAQNTQGAQAQNAQVIGIAASQDQQASRKVARVKGHRHGEDKTGRYSPYGRRPQKPKSTAQAQTPRSQWLFTEPGIYQFEVNREPTRSTWCLDHHFSHRTKPCDKEKPLQILKEPFIMPGLLPPDYIRRTPAGEAPATVEDAVFDMMSFAEELEAYTRWAVERDDTQQTFLGIFDQALRHRSDFTQIRTDLLTAISSNNCRAHALILNLHRVAKHASTHFFHKLATEFNTFGVDRRPAPLLEKQFIIDRLTDLKEARLRQSYGAQPDIPQQLWQEFHSVTEKILGEYVADVIATREQDRQKAKDLRTILESSQYTAAFSQVWIGTQLSMPAIQHNLMPSLIFTDQRILRNSLQNISERLARDQQTRQAQSPPTAGRAGPAVTGLRA
ncbi:hypothetical protein AYO22_10058 [Fonsecaea multimorphosa]|nr:hypothetical protein AYO22_10058 [Fonsecaea multimorphosa]